MLVDSITSWLRSFACRFVFRCAALCALSLTGTPVSADSLFQSAVPEVAADQILLISTRTAGTSCDPAVLERELVCRRLSMDSAGKPTWLSYDWHHLFEPEAAQMQTVFYIHGNRVSVGSDAGEGMAVYGSLLCGRTHSTPIRFIIWSWPSSQIPGLIKDYQVKASRTTSVSWQLAWFVDQMPPAAPLAMVGYSYGARAVSGAMHLLAGGQLEDLQLTDRAHPERSPASVALVAAAFDADWLQPGQDHERALSQIDRLVIATNHQDPAMRFFHLSTRHSRVAALGRSGIAEPRTLQAELRKVKYVDFSKAVGHSHVVFDYLDARPQMNQVWSRLLNEPSAGQNSLPVLPAYASLPVPARR